MKTKLFYLLSILLAVPLLGVAQTTITTDFENNTLQGWTEDNSDISVEPGGPYGSYYLHCVDETVSGVSRIVAPSVFHTNWGCQGRFSYSFQLIDKGGSNDPYFPRFTIKGGGGSISAHYTSATEVQESDGWVTVYGDYHTIVPGDPLPANWTMGGTSTIDDWNTLIGSVSEITVTIDLPNASTRETMGFDNFQLRSYDDCWVCVDIETISEPDTNCCYTIEIKNRLALTWDEIDFTVISGSADILSISRQTGQAYMQTMLPATTLQLKPDGTQYWDVGTGVSTICFGGASPIESIVEVSWMRNDTAYCKDTISVKCCNPCEANFTPVQNPPDPQCTCQWEFRFSHDSDIDEIRLFSTAGGYPFDVDCFELAFPHFAGMDDNVVETYGIILKTGSNGYDLPGCTTGLFRFGLTESREVRWQAFRNDTLLCAGIDSLICIGTYGIYGTKYEDLDGDCIKDPGEPGLPGWTINMTDCNGTVLATALTDTSGDYEFTDLAPGVYCVEEEIQSGWTQLCPPGIGTHQVDLNTGSQYSIDFGNMQNISFCPGNIITNGDFADNTPGEMGNPGMITPWSNIGTVDVHSSTGCYPPMPNLPFVPTAGVVGMWGRSSDDGELIYQEVTFVPGQTYDVSFCYRWADLFPEMTFDIYATDGAPTTFADFNPGNTEVLIASVTASDATSGWLTYGPTPLTRWICPQGALLDHVVVVPHSVYNNNMEHAYGYFDNLCIRPVDTCLVCDSVDILLESVVCDGTNGSGNQMYYVEVDVQNNTNNTLSILFESFQGDVSPGMVNVAGSQSLTLTFTDFDPSNTDARIRWSVFRNGSWCLCDSIGFEKPPCESGCDDLEIHGALKCPGCCEYVVSVDNNSTQAVTGVTYMIDGGTENGVTIGGACTGSGSGGYFNVDPDCAGDFTLTFDITPDTHPGTIKLIIYIEMEDDTCDFCFTYMCDTTVIPPIPCCDSLEVLPGEYGAENLDERLFKLWNTLGSDNAITYIEIDFDPDPCNDNGGSSLATPAYSLVPISLDYTVFGIPYDRIPNTGYFEDVSGMGGENADYVEFLRGVDWSCDWSGYVYLTVHHEDGTMCEFTYGPWNAVEGSSSTAVTSAPLDYQDEVYSGDITLLATREVGKNEKYISFFFESSSDNIFLAATGAYLPPIEYNMESQSPTRILRQFQNEKEVIFQLESPLSNGEAFPNMKLYARSTGGDDRIYILWVTFDLVGNAVRTGQTELTKLCTTSTVNEPASPDAFELLDFFPNPATGITTINYALGTTVSITLELNNQLGERVAIIEEGIKDPGHHTTQLNTNRLPSGTYYLRLSSANALKTRKMQIVK